MTRRARSGQGITAFGGGWFTFSPAGNMVFGAAPNAGGADGY
jgi:hypothetical protein